MEVGEGSQGCRPRQCAETISPPAKKPHLGYGPPAPARLQTAQRPRRLTLRCAASPRKRAADQNWKYMKFRVSSQIPRNVIENTAAWYTGQRTQTGDFASLSPMFRCA